MIQTNMVDEAEDPIYGHEQLGDHLDDEETVNIYRELALKHVEYIERLFAFLTESKSPGVSIWAAAYASDSSSLRGKSMSNKASELRISTQGLSKEIKRFQSEVMMIGETLMKPSAYMYKK